MDKMREEFEAWHVEQCKADGMDWYDLSSELDRDGDGYVYTGAKYAWRGWQASRAALCVELPIQYQAPLVDEPAMDADEVRWALEESGVSYK